MQTRPANAAGGGLLRLLSKLHSDAVASAPRRSPVPRRRQRYTPGEDTALQKAVAAEEAAHGPIRGRHGVWARVAGALAPRTPDSVRDRWGILAVTPGGGVKMWSYFPWTADEDRALMSAVREFEDGARAVDWAAVARAVGGGRTNRGCRQRHKHSLDVSRKLGRFSREEDVRLIELERQMPGDYASIARALGNNRTNEAVRDRLVNCLDSTIRWTRFSAKEDAILSSIIAPSFDDPPEGGGAPVPTDWAAASAALPGRTRQQCINRWLAIMPGKTSGGWSEEEDRRLCETYDRFVAERGVGKFTYGHVASILKDRNRKQCWARHRRLLQRKLKEHSMPQCRDVRNESRDVKAEPTGGRSRQERYQQD
jgi:Myb-like DNA-binding domain